MKATEKMKNGEPFDLLADLAASGKFNMTAEEMKSALDPSNYTGRCDVQVERYVEELKPLIAQYNETDSTINL